MFSDYVEAGQMLAKEVARVLEAPLDLVIVREAGALASWDRRRFFCGKPGVHAPKRQS